MSPKRPGEGLSAAWNRCDLRRTGPCATSPSVQRLGPYDALEPLGRGGMAVVFRARHRDTGEIVAVKTLPAPRENLIRSLRREVHALSRIQHPGVVRNAIQLAEPRIGKSDALRQALCGLVGHPDPKVRLQLALTLGESQSAAAGLAQVGQASLPRRRS